MPRTVCIRPLTSCLSRIDSSILIRAIEAGRKVSLKAIFPDKLICNLIKISQAPINSKGSLTLNALIRAISGKNSFGVQNLNSLLYFHPECKPALGSD